MINLSSFLIHITPIRGNKRLTNAIGITPKTQRVKRERSSIFTIVIETIDQNNKIIVEAIDQISFM
jgi:hypothetical protein